MIETTPRITLDPASALALDLPYLPGRLRRLTLRSLLALSAGAVRVEGSERLAATPSPAIFALTHHNAWEAVLAPAALVALRRGRLIRFLVDWMFVDLPWTGWLVRQIEPVPVYAKPARFRLGEGRRRARLSGSTLDALLASLGRGEDVGVYPEGRRSRDPWLLGRLRRGVAYVALRSGAPVVPVGIDFPARDRLRRVPHVGRFVLRIGPPIEFAAERAAWLAAGEGRERRGLERRLAPALIERLERELAMLSRKVQLPASAAAAAAASAPEPGAPVRTARRRLEVARVRSAEDREAALSVVAEVYGAEKRWIAEASPEIPREPAEEESVSWLLARVEDEPVGVVRLQYDPPLELPAEAEVELEPGIDLARLAASGRFVEIGRLMIRERWRSRPSVVLELMRAAVEEVVGRGYTHLVTAVFEDDPHSPYGFHTRQLGFERIGTHRRGELLCASRRILLVLDLARSYRTLKQRGQAIATRLSPGLEERIEHLGVASTSGADDREAVVAP